MRWRLLLVILVAPGLSLPAGAEPMFTTLDKAVKRSQHIVVARYLGRVDPKRFDRYAIEVSKVLKGDPNWTGRRVVRRAHGEPRLKLNSRCVAFIDEQGRFHWVARPRQGFSLETGPLLLHGFYDFNAYLVSPGIVTLPQLRELVKPGGQLMYRFEGPLMFWNPARRRIEASSIRLQVTRNWSSGATQIRGLPAVVLKRWRKAPGVIVNHVFAGDVRITLRRAWPGPLVLRGAIDGVTQTGFRARFWIVSPLLLRRSDFDHYIARKDLSHSYPQIELRRSGRPALQIQIGRRIGHVGEVLQGTRRWQIQSLSSTDTDNLVASLGTQRMVVRFGKLTRSGKIFDGQGVTGMLTQRLLQGPLACTVRLGATQTACTLHLKRVAFAPEPLSRRTASCAIATDSRHPTL